MERELIPTREAARALGRRPVEALTLLKAAGIHHVRLGSAYFWSAEGVRALARILATARPTGDDRAGEGAK